MLDNKTTSGAKEKKEYKTSYIIWKKNMTLQVYIQIENGKYKI